MVGRLVQQHQIRFFGHQFGKGGAAAFTPRRGGHRHFGLEFQAFGDHGHLVMLCRIKLAGRIIAQRFPLREVGVLFHVTHRNAGRDDEIACVSLS